MLSALDLAVFACYMVLLMGVGVYFTRQQKGLRFNPILSLVDDADTQARWYYRLKQEYRRAHAEGRPFDNPVKPRTLRWRS